MAAVPPGLATALQDRYRLDRELGAGGMATVYLAEDLKHHRMVAVKVLRPELAATLGPERFAREIEVTARLQHPHILPVHDSGEASGFFYYVMPYVEGETLRDRLARSGELPVPEALRLMGEIAEALAAAHKSGVVHRDIKPENIILSGRHALVMDFGVAKAVTDATGRQQLTTAGVALGTPAYMAPEQATADPHLDHRVDIYAIGVVAYEMLTGQPPFHGLTPQQTLAAHVTQSPAPLGERRPGLAAPLDTVVMKCLAKRPADRYQTAEELLAVLEPLATPSGGITPAQTQPVAALSRQRFPVPVFILAALLVFGASLGWYVLNRPFGITTANFLAVTSEPGREWMPALSPDGSEVAFATYRDGRPALVIRSAVGVAGAGEILLAREDSGGISLPAWSSDGELVRFWHCGGSLCAWRQVGRLGGASSILELPRQTGTAAWSRDDARIAFVANDSFFVYTVADHSTRLLAVHPDGWDQHSLAWSPDGRWIAYVNGNPTWRTSVNTAPSSIWLVAVGSGQRVAVTTEKHLNVSPAWLDSRHLLFVSNRDGPREVYVVGVGSSGARGEPQKVPGGTDAHSISLSSDGKRLTFSKLAVRQNVWEYPIRASGSVSIREGREITHGTQVVEEHDVSPDGKWLAYDSNRRGNADIYKMRLNGGEPVPVVTGPEDDFAPRWSPDGREILYYGGPRNEVYVVPADGGSPARLTDTPGFDNFPAWSPDGLHIAFHSDRTGTSETWTLSREHPGAPWREAMQLTDFGCFGANWLRDGSGVLCVSLSSEGPELVAVSPTKEVLWRRNLKAAGLTMVQAWTLSDIESTIYLGGVHSGRSGIWSLPLSGGGPRLVVDFDDPLLKAYLYAGGITVHRDRMYLSVGQFESDVWVMDLRY